MNFSATFDHYCELIEDGVERLIPASSTRPESLHEAMRYSMQAGGKRLRPVLVLAGNSLFPSRADAIPAAVAIECIHTYSLIHDDLPCMDNSDLRRGRPSLHIKHGEALALLAGDALLTHAFWLLAEHYSNHADISVRLLGELGAAAGSHRLIAGQVEDVEGEDSKLNAEELDYIHLNKTAAMITASLTMGVMHTEADESCLNKVREIGRNLGLAYQIVDDILDATSDTESLGKTAGQDAANHKNTYVSVHGLEAARARAGEVTAGSIAKCRDFDADTAFLEELILGLEHRIK